MEEEMEEIVEKEFVVSDTIKELAEKKVVLHGSVCEGCGAQIGLKVALQLIDNPVLVFADDHISPIREFINVPSIKSTNPAPAAAAIARILDCNVICYIGNAVTAETMQSIISAKKENVIYISYNTEIRRMLSEAIPSYSATASISHMEDYINKIKKAVSLHGLRFIELFSPCPKSGFDPSNTVEVARLAVESGIWPLYEIERGKLSLTYKPTRLDPIGSYLEAAGISKTQEETAATQERVSKNWKRLSRR
jgi:pyruvate/2-oxoacid:ferredoxin oxidoreductase beta subunit